MIVVRFQLQMMPMSYGRFSRLKDVISQWPRRRGRGQKNAAKSGEKKKQWRHRRNDAKPLCNTPWTFNW